MRVVRAADIGAGSLRAALVDETGRILDRRVEPTPSSPATGLALLRRCWEELGPAEGSALVLPGAIRTRDGEITQSPNLPRWEGARPGAELGCPVLNDANGALLGEAWLGALAGRRSALMLTLGTGVGGAVLLDGRLWTGATGCAGEIGQVPVHPDGPIGRSGARGYLEVYASAHGVAKAALCSDGTDAAERARAGEPFARGAFRKAGQALGIALAGLVNVFNPEAICLGGGLAASFDLFEEPLRRELEARAFRLALEGLEITTAKLGGDAGLLGAARLALDSGRSP